MANLIFLASLRLLVMMVRPIPWARAGGTVKLALWHHTGPAAGNIGTVIIRIGFGVYPQNPILIIKAPILPHCCNEPRTWHPKGSWLPKGSEVPMWRILAQTIIVLPILESQHSTI